MLFRSGNSSLWSGQAMATSSIRWLSLSAGRERSEARDDLLDFGNASTIRDRASVQAQPGRVSLNGTWENAIIERGRALTFAHLRQRTASGSLSVRLARTALATGTVGNFDSIATVGTDTTRYWGGALEVTPSSSFHVTGWLRRDHITEIGRAHV